MSAPTSDAIPPDAREFHTTRWSMVLRAGGSNAGGRNALADLCGIYWYPLYAFVRRQGHNAHDAQDLTQEFFARLLERGGVEGVAPEKGRFRSWLLAALKYFLINEWHRTRTQKRGGGAVHLSMDDDAEERYLQEPADPLTAEKLFDRRWALLLLDRVLERLGTEQAGLGKTVQFEALKFCLSGEKQAYAEVAVTLGMTESAVKVAVHRLRERYRTLIRAEIAETVASPDEVDGELRDLFAALSG